MVIFYKKIKKFILVYKNQMKGSELESQSYFIL